MPYIIEIECFLFNESEQSFENFISVFKDGCKQHFNHLLINNFSGLLQHILDQTKQMNPIFFKSLDYSATVLERAFHLLKQKKIDSFSPSMIYDIVYGDHQTHNLLSSKPSIISQISANQLIKFYQDCQTLNPNLEISKMSMLKELSETDTLLFQACGISCPLPLQLMSYNLATDEAFDGKWMIQLDTGSGKTALCFTVAANYASRGFKSITINNSDELTFRDFKKAQQAAIKIPLEVSHLASG